MSTARLALCYLATTAAVGIAATAAAQIEPGAMVVTHHETIPNPVFGSTFRVAEACRTPLQPCAWEQPGTWTAVAIPGLDSRVIVDGNVLINSDTATALSVGVYPGGTLSFTPDASTRLRTADLVVFAGGALEIGTLVRPIAPAFTAEVVIRDVAFSDDPMQHLRGILVIDGTVQVHGRPLTDTFLRTAEPSAAGEATVVLESSAVAAGWRVGDTVAIPTSSQCPVASNAGCRDETEDRMISEISDDGRTLTFSTAMSFSHPGARNAAGQVDFLPHVVNKSRNVVFRSENPGGIRGHILLHGRTKADIRYAAILSFGRTDVRDLGPTNQKGRYPLHAHHLIGPLSAPPPANQFTLLGNVIDFGPENYTQERKWGLTIHGSHFGLVEGNVVDRASGAGLVTEDASETGNIFRRNFVLRIVDGNGERTEDLDPTDGSKLGRAGVAYWFNGGGGNTYEDNVAAAVAECTYCYGFKFDNVYNGTINVPAFRGADPYQGQGIQVDSYEVGLARFARNEAYAVPNGLTIWWFCADFETPRDNCSSLVKDFRVWHHHRWGYFAYETNQMTVDGFTHRGDAKLLTNPYEGVIGMFLVDYFQRRTIVRNANIQGAAIGVVAPVDRDIRGSSGANVGITRIEDSVINASLGILIAAPWSVNGCDDLAPQTTILRNVRFEYPATRQDAHIVITPEAQETTNLDLRNEVWIYDNDQAQGANDLYVVPAYQPESRCDDAIGVCSTDITASYPHLTGVRVYPLR